MSWTAVLPLKSGPERKSRLAGHLSRAARVTLTDGMAAHVIACLKGCGAIDHILLLSPVSPKDATLGWWQDAGRGLNGELMALRDAMTDQSLLVLHGDLPLLSSDDLTAMIEAAASGRVAIAPDAHGSGTNALAIPQPLVRDFAFAFGPDSCALHSQAAGDIVRVERPGLAIDVDTPEDLERAKAAGFVMAEDADTNRAPL